MWNTIEHKGIGRLFEACTFIEAFGIFLCLNVNQFGVEVLFCCINGMKHDFLNGLA